MATLRELQNNFSFLDLEPNNVVLKKCLELCSKYALSAEDFVDQWSAFSLANPKLQGCSPSIAALEIMERKELMKEFEKKNVSKQSDRSIIDNSSAPQTKDTEVPQLKKRTRSPESSQKLEPQIASSQINTSSLVLSQINENYKFSERSDPLKTVLSVGCIKESQTNEQLKDFCVTVKKWGERNSLSPDVRYMSELLSEIARSVNNIIFQIGTFLVKKYKLENLNDVKSAGCITTFGKICCDSDAKLNSVSVQLQNSWELGKGNRIYLNVSKLPSYAIFPGQIAAVQGENVSHRLVAQKLLTDATLHLPENEIKIPGALDMIIASGPFTSSDNLLYEPLKDLLKYAVQKKPHVLMLIGPFVDENHKILSSEAFDESYDTFFNNLIECVMTPFKDQSTTQVILVASQKDIFHHPVYPTPPYSFKHKYPNLHLMPDPIMIDIDGLVVGVTSTDILMHLSKEEICFGPNQSDRMSRLISHLIEQQSFYPLNPANPEVRMNMKFFECHGVMEVTPHLLILPSSLRYFVKDVKGCLVVNPEKLTKGYVAGTFAHLKLVPPFINSIFNRTKCDIIRI